jgi:hypothetical protein
VRFSDRSYRLASTRKVAILMAALKASLASRLREKAEKDAKKKDGSKETE